MPRRAALGIAGLVVALAACGGSSSTPDAAHVRPTVFGDDRPATLRVPAGFDPEKSYPLVVVLHGYGATGFLQESYFGIRAEVDAGATFEIAPDGHVDSTGAQFWNADPACCDFDGTHPDDSAYIGKLVDDILAVYPIDRARVFVIGHSNGGYMAYRMACDRPDVITAVGVLAGIVATDPATCHPSQPLAVLHMHGTADDMVPYPMTATYAGAVGSVTRWAGYDTCGATLTPGATLDLDTAVAGAETQVSTFACTAPLAVELWTLNGSGHVPSPTAAFEPALWAWLNAHAR